MNDPRSFSDIVYLFIDLALLAVPVVAGLSFLVFVWGLAKFIYNVRGDEKAIADGKSLMVWGLIALFVMISIWGIIRFLHGEFGLESQFGIPFLPV